MTYEGLTIKESASEILVSSPEAIYDIFKDSSQLAQETFSIVTLNCKNKMIGEHLISLGTINKAIVHPREVFRPAIMDSAASICVSHNHPSGDVTPSSEDIKATKELVAAGKIIGIRVLDHIIVGDGNTPFLSLRESGLVEFN